MLAPMTDPGSEPPPPRAPEPATEPVPVSAEPAYLPFGAYAPPSVLLPPRTPTWASTYELPSARRVASAGLQLSLSATSDLRRGSIYIGLLMLAAASPLLAVVVVSLLGIAPGPERLVRVALSDPTLLTAMGPSMAMLALTFEAAFVLVVLLVVAISIDAQAIAIAVLAGRATGRPLRLWEALRRARQVFWRLAGASFLLGIPAAIIGFVVGSLLGNPNQSPETAQLVSQLLTTFLLAPLAYVNAGIVVGDVGVIEAARRSVRLFRARPKIGLVVVLFPLVASAIQTLALLSGIDIVGRVVEALHLQALTGGAGVVVAVTLLFVAIVAFGSLLFTIAAIVTAPQVVAFLGLTLFAGGIDKVRVAGPRPAGIRWMTRRMAVTIGVAIPLLVVTVVGVGSAIPDLPDVSGPFATAGPATGLPGVHQPSGDASTLVGFLGERAAVYDKAVSTTA